MNPLYSRLASGCRGKIGSSGMFGWRKKRPEDVNGVFNLNPRFAGIVNDLYDKILGVGASASQLSNQAIRKALQDNHKKASESINENQLALETAMINAVEHLIGHLNLTSTSYYDDEEGEKSGFVSGLGVMRNIAFGSALGFSQATRIDPYIISLGMTILLHDKTKNSKNKFMHGANALFGYIYGTCLEMYPSDIP
jgi:hypothetical protein